MMEIRDQVATHAVTKSIIDKILSENPDFQEGEQDAMLEAEKKKFMASGSRQFFTELKGEFADIPLDVFINIKGKQKDLARNADKITNILREVIKTPQIASTFSKTFNELLEASGLSPIDFSQMEIQPAPQQAPSATPSSPMTPPGGLPVPA
jgi:hypothetical protein